MTNDHLGPHTSEGLRRAMAVASEHTRVPGGLAETTWLRGRRVRRRRAGLASGGLAAVLAATALGWALVGGAPGADDGIPAGPSTPASVDAPTLTEEAPEPPQTEPDVVPVDASAETERVWQVLRRTCLESWGYQVWVTGSSLSASRSGARAGDYTRDTALCDAQLAMRLPPVDVLPGGDGQLPEAATVALGEVYDDYVVTAACVEELGLPVDPAPSREDFIDLFAREWMPSWHPWTAAADAGEYEQVRSACPVGG